MAVPTASDGIYDQMLTDFAVGYSEQMASAYIADKVFPVVPVGLPSGVYREFPRGYFFQDQVGPLPDNGEPNEVYLRTVRRNFFCEVEALRARITTMEGATWVGPGDPRNNKVKLVASQHMVHRDRKWVDAFMRPGVWARDLHGTATGSEVNATPFWDSANFDIIDYISAQIDALTLNGVSADRITLVIGRSVRRALRRNALVKDAIKYTQVGVASLDLLASLFDIMQVLSPTGAYNRATGEIIDTTTGQPVLDNDFVRLVGDKDALLVVSGESSGIDTVSGGVHFAWTGLQQVTSANQNTASMLTPMPGMETATMAVNRGTWSYGEWLDQLTAYEPKMISPDLGSYYAGIVQ